MWDTLVERLDDPLATLTFLRRGGRVRRVEARHLRVVLNQRGQACRDRLKLLDVLVELNLKVGALRDGVAIVVIDVELDVIRQREKILAEGFQVGQDALDSFTHDLVL